MNTEIIYNNRFSNNGALKEKDKIWKTLCKFYFQKLIPINSVVIDIGAGYCEFINNINAEKKYGFDINPDSKKYANKDVCFIHSELFDIKPEENADIIFVSHFLEHLDSKEDVIKAFDKFGSILNKNGKVIVLTPNITLLGGKYWDFIDHKVPLNDLSVIEAAELSGFRCVKKIKRFLPYTTKSKIPKCPILVWLYLKLLPFSGWFFGKTSLIVLEKTDE